MEGQGLLSPAAWASLSFIAAPFCDCCGLPFGFETDEASGALCSLCLIETPPFKTARSALIYDDVSRDLILGFKHGDQTQSVPVMVPWLKQAGADMLADADMLVPVPLHRWRLLKRRYNQSALMAAALARAVSKPHCPDALLRIRSTPPQGHLKAPDREKNVRHAFTVSPTRKARIKGCKIILIDDVFTTGSTVRECAEALLSGGAASVGVLTLARVVRPHRFD